MKWQERKNREFLPQKNIHFQPLCRIVLVEPLIPENTGNISRTCVALEAELHLVHPLGFEVTETRLKRAGLDYWKHLAWQEHPSFDDWLHCAERVSGSAIHLIETGDAPSIFEAVFKPGDWLVFGKETAGLTPDRIDRVRESGGRQWTIPTPGEVRSLNLSNAVAISAFELFRQVRAVK